MRTGVSCGAIQSGNPYMRLCVCVCVCGTRFSHATGAALWFEDDPQLCNWIFLQPAFLTQLLACIQRQMHPEKQTLHRSLPTAFELLTKAGVLQLGALPFLWDPDERQEGTSAVERAQQV